VAIARQQLGMRLGQQLESRPTRDELIARKIITGSLTQPICHVPNYFRNIVNYGNNVVPFSLSNLVYNSPKYSLFASDSEAREELQQHAVEAASQAREKRMQMPDAS
jgi:hypothetical protein